jgi:hypothetical protein
MHKLKSDDLKTLTRDVLLRTRLCDLPVSLDTPWFLQAKKSIEHEIRRRDLCFQPHFWIGDEWFCPDGVPGVAVPFFLLHPRLEQLEREQIGFVDGDSQLERLKILRHEVGHAFDNAYRLRRRFCRERKYVFGDPRQPYPRSYAPVLYSRGFVRNLKAGYAQSHPDEDFAETFAVWLTPRKNWLNKYQKTKALEKLLTIDRWAEALRGQRPLLSNRRRVDPIENRTLTLGEYYKRKQKQFRVHEVQKQTTDCVASVRGLLKPSSSDSARPALALLELVEKQVIEAAREQLGQPAYRIKPLYLHLKNEARNHRWQVEAPSQQEWVTKLERTFTKKAEQYIKKKLFYVVM